VGYLFLLTFDIYAITIQTLFHKKAEVVVELRQELFGEVVDIVSDETDVEMYE
jgi:hypothetical protein